MLILKTSEVLFEHPRVRNVTLSRTWKQEDSGPVTDNNITVRSPDARGDKAFLKGADFDYYTSSFEETGQLPRGGILLFDTMANLICNKTRRVGAFSLVGNYDDTGAPELRVDTLWIQPKYRGRGYAEKALQALCAQTDHPVALRCPVHPALQKVAARVGVRLNAEPPEAAARERERLDEALVTLNEQCSHGIGCKPCLYRVLLKVIDASWAREEMKIQMARLSRSAALHGSTAG